MHVVTDDDDTVDDDVTVVTSNYSRKPCALTPAPPGCAASPNLAATALLLLGTPSHEHLNTLTVVTTHAIADTGATLIFIMDTANVVNKKVATRPITIGLPDGRQVLSTHVCDIIIPGLPTILVGHVVPDLAVPSLIGIRPLCKAGCTVTFDVDKCDVSIIRG